MGNIKQEIKDIIKTGDFGQYLPEFLYHATFSGTLDSIKENGLGNLKSGYKSLWRLQYEQGVYLDTDAGSAESFVEGSDDDRLDTESVVVFKIPTAKLDHSLLEVDWNNTWNTDIIEDSEFESLKDYFDSITYFYGGVIPFADLVMVENLNEEKDNLEGEEVDLQPMSKKQALKDILEGVKEEFEEHDITSQEEYLDIMLLPDGTALLPKPIKNEEDGNDSPKYEDYDIENFDYFIGGYSEEKEFTKLTGSIHMYTSNPDDENPFEIHLNPKKPTQKQYDAIEKFANSFIPYTRVSIQNIDLFDEVDEDADLITFDIYKPNGKKVSIKTNDSDKLISAIKRFYSTGVLKESIDHREVYKSLTFSDNPERGPIFISKEGKFANIGRFVTHAKIFSGQDYEGDDYYVLHDAFDLIKANGGNRFEPFAYIDLWKIPNPAQKKAIITWMYYLLEWGMYQLQVNTSSSNETYNLTNKIPEEVYDEITRGLLESTNEDVGYRNDDYFGDGKRSLLKVIVHETTELGNIDIPDTVLSTFKHTEEQGKIIKEFIELIDSGDPIEDFDIYIETLMDVIHGEYPEAKYALWLCKTKDDVKEYYGGTDSNIGTYKIEYPKPISDLGEEGLLYVFSKVPTLING